MKSNWGGSSEPYEDPALDPDISTPKVTGLGGSETRYVVMLLMLQMNWAKACRATHRVAGKFTAQVFSLKKMKNTNAVDWKKELHDHAWFTAYAPMKNPRLVVTVILENAGGGS